MATVAAAEEDNEVPNNPNAPVLVVARLIATLVFLASLALVFSIIVVFKTVMVAFAGTLGLSPLTFVGLGLTLMIGWLLGGNAKTVAGSLDM